MWADTGKKENEVALASPSSLAKTMVGSGATESDRAQGSFVVEARGWEPTWRVWSGCERETQVGGVWTLSIGRYLETVAVTHSASAGTYPSPELPELPESRGRPRHSQSSVGDRPAHR